MFSRNGFQMFLEIFCYYCGGSNYYRYCYIIIIIIIILVITRILNYTAETNHVSTVYSVAAVLYLQFALHVMLFRP